MTDAAPKPQEAPPEPKGNPEYLKELENFFKARVDAANDTELTGYIVLCVNNIKTVAFIGLESFAKHIRNVGVYAILEAHRRKIIDNKQTRDYAIALGDDAMQQVLLAVLKRKSSV